MKIRITLNLLCIVLYTQIHGQICSIIPAQQTRKLSDTYVLFSSSGNANIDNATRSELAFLCTRFLVVPNFYFYDDNDGKNSKASTEVTNFQCPDGTIIFGKRLFNNIFLYSSGGTAIPLIIAHEFAHICDFKYGVLNHVSNKKKELFADYFAGVYMSLRSRLYIPVDVNAAMQVFRDLGETDFGDVDKHGNSEERVNALNAGFMEAESYFNTGTQNQFSLIVALKAAKTYIKSLPDDQGDENGAKEPEDDK